MVPQFPSGTIPLFAFQMDILSSSHNQPDSESTYAKLYQEVRRLTSLHVENAKLLVTEKLTLLLGRITLVAVSFVVCSCALIFLSMSVADWLLRSLEPCWTYLIVGGFYILLAVICAIFRRQLIVDPIARYISRVIIDPPSCANENNNNSNTSNLPAQHEK